MATSDATQRKLRDYIHQLEELCRQQALRQDMVPQRPAEVDAWLAEMDAAEPPRKRQRLTVAAAEVPSVQIMPTIPRIEHRGVGSGTEAAPAGVPSAPYAASQAEDEDFGVQLSGSYRIALNETVGGILLPQRLTPTSSKSGLSSQPSALVKSTRSPEEGSSGPSYRASAASLVVPHPTEADVEAEMEVGGGGEAESQLTSPSPSLGLASSLPPYVPGLYPPHPRAAHRAAGEGGGPQPHTLFLPLPLAMDSSQDFMQPTLLASQNVSQSLLLGEEPPPPHPHVHRGVATVAAPEHAPAPPHQPQSSSSRGPSSDAKALSGPLARVAAQRARPSKYLPSGSDDLGRGGNPTIQHQHAPQPQRIPPLSAVAASAGRPALPRPPPPPAPLPAAAAFAYTLSDPTPRPH